MKRLPQALFTLDSYNLTHIRDKVLIQKVVSRNDMKSINNCYDRHSLTYPHRPGLPCQAGVTPLVARSGEAWLVPEEGAERPVCLRGT